MKTIILYGMRGTGKSLVGKELSMFLGYNFIDLDKYISKKNNSKLSDFIKKNGWEKFRYEENKCLKEVLKNNSNKIISLGGGTICYESNREELFKDKNTKIIYLNTNLKNISTRILKDEKSGDIRNSITGKNVLEELKGVFEERKEIYKNNCDFEVDNNGEIYLTINQIINKLNYGGVCVPIISPHLTSPKGRGIKGILDIYEEIKNNRKIEFIELRLDLIFKNIDFEILEKIIKKCPKKVICTNRAEFELGEFIGTPEESLEILRKCLDFGADYVDIELKSLDNIKLFKDNFLENNRLIISHHNFTKTPNIYFLKNILEKMGKYNPAVYKIAVIPEVKEDVGTIYELNNYFKKSYKNKTNIFISMGKIGKETRVNLPKRGNLLTFGTYGESSSAPGQINYKELYKKIFTTKEVLFLGGPQISGSFSPFMHNFSSNKLKIEENKFIYKLNKIEQYNIYDAQDFVDKLESDEKYLGGNVTMPYKIDIYNYLKKLDRLDENAKMVGAVNTLFKKDGKIYGTNTDLEGISGPILEKLGNNIDKINSVYILGAGGASRAAIAASIKMGIKNINVLNRNQKGLDEVVEHFNCFLGDTQKLITKIYDVVNGDTFPEMKNKSIIINTLPFGFKENLPKSPILFKELDKILPNLELYFEAVYDSEKGDTPVVKEIICRGTSCGYPDINICRGIEMLIGQAKNGFELWSNGGKFRSNEITNILLKNKNV